MDASSRQPAAIYVNGLNTCLRFGLLEGKLAEVVRALIAVQVRYLSYHTTQWTETRAAVQRNP